MIVGVTHNGDGRVVQRLSVSTKLAIGLPPNGDRNYPTKLDHFVFLRKKRTAKGVEWEPDPELSQHYGKECREVRIVLIDDDIENIFPTSYAWWTTVERKCWGDGASGTRRTTEKPSGQPWTPCGNGCPELASGLCKPSGDLRFVLADFPRLGSVCRIHTSSYRSIRQIHSALQEIQSFTGGRLAGLTAKLVVRPEGTAYFDPKDKRKKSTTIWALSLEVDGEDMKKLLANLTENARVFAEARKLLGGGRVIDVVEDEAEQAAELTAEFSGAADASPLAKPSEPKTNGQAKTEPPFSIRANHGLAPEAKSVTASAAGIGEPLRNASASPNGRDAADSPPWEAEPSPAPTNGPATVPATANQAAAPQAAASGSKPDSAATGNGAAPSRVALRGMIGPLVPDAAGQTVRRNKRGVEYVVFQVAQNGSATPVYCNQPELLPEIARRQQRQATAQVTVVGDNGHRYYVLERFVEA
jgi:hypothetical protein